MNTTTHDPNAPLLSELHWFVHQRWRAGLIIAMAAIVSKVWIPWASQQSEILSVGLVILTYNAAFWTLFRVSPSWLEIPVAQRGVAWAQVTLDLLCLTALTLFTGGIFSPLLGLFVLHMIFASLLLQPPQYTSYLAWAMGLAMMAAGLWLTQQWPSTSTEQLIGAGWIGTLLMTVYFTSHITNNMRANYDRTRAILDAAADGVLSITETGHIERGNPAALAMFGYTAAQMTGIKITSLVPNALLPTQPHSATPVISISVANSDILGRRKDGSTFPVEITTSSMRTGGKQAYTSIVRDMTERERTEATLRKLNLELKKHQQQLIQHEKMVSVGQMAAGVAHEIANPLANMDSLIQLVERNPDRLKSDTPQELRDQITRINQIVRQLKEFAHPAASERRRIPVTELVDAAMGMIRFDKRHDCVQVLRPSDSPCCEVLVHPLSIQQVLVNVIINALDAVSEENSPQITISACQTQEGNCCITIQDNGTGIPADHLRRIFEPFYTTKPLGRGTGLGLSISYNLVQQDHGEITVQSELGEGTSFTICLPVSQAEC